MKKLLIIIFLLASAEARAQLSHAQLWCQLGGQRVSTSGQKSQNEVQRSIPSCNVEVFNSGTTSDASIFQDNLSTPTPKANPFAGLSNGTIDFWAAPACYDIVTSGGVGSDTFPAPYTYTAVCLGSSGGGGGGGGSGSVTSVGIAAPAGFQIFGSPVTGIGTLGFSMPTGWTSQDLLIGSGANAVSRLPKGADNTCLTLSGGLINWGAGPCVGTPPGTTNQITKYTNGPSSIIGDSSLFDDGVNPVQSPNGISVMTGGANRILTNATPATTVLNQLVERNSSGLAINASTSSIRALGLAGQGAGTDGGGVQVIFAGFGQCVFDNQTVINDYVVPSTTTAGLCHDAGATRPLNAEILGTVTTANAGVATLATVDFFTGDTSQTTPSAVTPCGSSPGPIAYYTLASTLSCDTAFQTDGAGNVTGVSSTYAGASAGYLFFTQSSQPSFPVNNSAYLFAPTSIPSTYALKLPSALGTAGQALTISGVSSNVATLSWSSAAGCPEGTCIQNVPLADQTITGTHQLINQGTETVGPDLSTFDTFVQDNAVTSPDVSISGANLGSTGIQGIGQGAHSTGVYALASGAYATGLYSTTKGDGSNGDTPEGLFVGAGDETSSGYAVPYGISSFSTYISHANSIGAAVGILTQAVGMPDIGTSIQTVEGSSARAQNTGAGTINHMTHYSTTSGNINSGGGTVVENYGYDVETAETVGTTNAAFHSVDQGSGASNYGILLAGVTHNKLGSGLTVMGSAQLTSISGSTQCLHVDTTGLISGAGGDCATGGSGSVTSVATTSPLAGGPITTAGTITCTTCVVATSPGLGLAHFAGSTQAVTSSLVVNADITAATIDLTAKVTGILPSANGGTANGFFTVSGPASSAKTFTFPNASSTVLTSNAAVTVAQGGTGLASGTSGGIPAYTGSTTITSSGVLSASTLVKGGGAGATPLNSLFTDDGTTGGYSGTGGFNPTFTNSITCNAFAESGASPAAKIAACVTALSSGGTIDARGFPCFTGANAQTWDQTVELGFTGAGGTNGKGHVLIRNQCTQWNVTITDKQSVPLVVHPQSAVIDVIEGVNSSNGMVAAASVNVPEMVAANCDVCWLHISAISRAGSTVTVTTSTSGPSLTAQPLVIYGVTDLANFANGTVSATGSGTSYTYTQAGSAVSSSGGAAGFGYIGYHGSVDLIGMNSTINSSATMLHGVHVYGALQGTMIRGLNVSCPANGEGLLIDANGTSVGPLEIDSDTVDCASATASRALVINTAGTGGQMGGVNIRGGLYAHAGTGQAIITTSDTGGNFQNQGTSFFGVSVEDNNATAIGLLINNADNVNVVGGFQCGSASGNGADCIKLTGSSMTNISIQSPMQNAYTNTVDDLSNSHNVQLTQNRVPFYGYGTNSNPANEWSWHTNGSSGDKIISLDNSGVGEKNTQQQTGGQFAKTTASLQTWKSIPIYASQNISFECHGFWQGSTTAASLGVAVTTPASPTNIRAWAKILSALGPEVFTEQEVTASATAFVGATAAVANTTYPFSFYGTVENGSTAGTLAIQVENGAASGTMNIMSGSWCRFDHP